MVIVFCLFLFIFPLTSINKIIMVCMSALQDTFCYSCSTVSKLFPVRFHDLCMSLQKILKQITSPNAPTRSKHSPKYNITELTKRFGNTACHENFCPPAKNCPRTKYCSKSLAKNCPTCQFLSHWRIALQKGPNVGQHNIMYIAILANRVAKGSQWQATYSRYLYWRIAWYCRRKCKKVFFA